jgi:hypothetical protein
MTGINSNGYYRMGDNIFREIPTREQTLEWLGHLQLDGFQDSHPFNEFTFPREPFSRVLLELEPYYYPCKAKIYLHREMTMSRSITVLRQILRPFNYTIRTHERFIHNKKSYEYYISPLESAHLLNTPTTPLNFD